MISRETFRRMCAAIEDMYGETREQEQAQDMVLELLAIQGVEVEPESCLPDVSQNLTYQRHDGALFLYDQNVSTADSISGYMIVGNISDNIPFDQQEAYAKLFVVAPQLAQAVADLLREKDKTGMLSEEIEKRLRRAVIHAGVSVEWLTGKEDSK